MIPASDTDSPICVTVTPTFSDYLRLHWRVLFRRMRLLAAIAAFVLAFFLAAPLLPLEGETVAAKYFRALPALVLPALMFVVLPIFTYRAVRQRWQAAGDLREPRTYTFTDAGVHVTGETFEGFVAWSNIMVAERAGELVLLRTGQQQFYLLPVRSFDGDEVLARFFRLVAAKVSDCRW